MMDVFEIQNYNFIFQGGIKRVCPYCAKTFRTNEGALHLGVVHNVVDLILKVTTRVVAKPHDGCEAQSPNSVEGQVVAESHDGREAQSPNTFETGQVVAKQRTVSEEVRANDDAIVRQIKNVDKNSVTPKKASDRHAINPIANANSNVANKDNSVKEVKDSSTKEVRHNSAKEVKDKSAKEVMDTSDKKVKDKSLKKSSPKPSSQPTTVKPPLASKQSK
jgi:hypothetical protein